ncbi:MAG: tRNA (adenosine(37)-N6)-threonylcarbamoyltransferase complex transferase subunit TsaD, partial [Dongiaceae bacterium]
GCDFSFAGLKTALRQRVAALAPDGRLGERDRDDLAAAFQAAVADVLADRTQNALRIVRAERPEVGVLVLAGGVAANRFLRARLETVAAAAGLRLVAPPPRLCTDNAAMIAWAGLERLRLGLRDGLDFAPRPRWPLDPTAAQAGQARP